MSGSSCENGNEGMAESLFSTRARIGYSRRFISAVICIRADLKYLGWESHSVSKSIWLRGDPSMSYLIINEQDDGRHSELT